VKTSTVIFSLAVATIVAVTGTLAMGNVRMFHFGAAAPSASASRLQPGTRAEFAYLAAQTSNNCSLQPATVGTYPDASRIQGSCCSPMDWGRYDEQVRGLQAYHDIPQVPKDPYDVSAALAKQLFTYEHGIHLTAAQQATYDQAMRMTPEKGPCCCKCWRWHAFKGLAGYLIVHRHFSAQRVASVIGLVDGCGGKA
jgi:hypothetical protein